MSDSPALTEREQRFDAWRRRVGLGLGPALFVAILALPSGLEPASHRLAATIALVMTWWLSEALPLPATALVGPALAVVLGVAPVRAVLAPFADPVIFLFLGSFLIAEALRVHGLDRRIALWILSRPAASSSPDRLRLALAVVTAGLSMWISNTATAAMMLPIALGLLGSLGARPASSTSRGLLLGVAYAASIGGIATPVGTPPNLIALGFLDRLDGRSIDFLTFLGLGLPIAIALLVANHLVCRLLLPDDVSAGARGDAVGRQRETLPGWGPGQYACAVAFGLAVTLWLLPGIVRVAGIGPAGVADAVKDHLPEAVVAILAAGVLFAWPVGKGRALQWEHAARVDFGTLLLFGGGLSMGKLMFDTGLAERVGRFLVEATGVSSLWGLTALAIVTSVVLTELVSNTAAVTMLAPLVIALASELGVPHVPPLLGVAFAASLAFMLPISTPPNAIVYGSGQVPLTSMVRVGVCLDVVGVAVILAGLRLLSGPLGLL